jgi:hypothetical protein
MPRPILSCLYCQARGRVEHDPEAYGVLIDCPECKGFGAVPVKLVFPEPVKLSPRKTARGYYEGFRYEHGCVVRNHDGVRVPMRLDLWAHSPTGLEWGYGGSGPAQCALAVLADLTDYLGVRETAAVRLHQHFKGHVVSRFPGNGTWAMDRSAVADYWRNAKRDDHAYWSQWFKEQLAANAISVAAGRTSFPYRGRVQQG